MKRIINFIIISFIVILLNFFLQKISHDFYSLLNLISVYLIYIALKANISNKMLFVITFLFGMLNDSLSSNPLGISSASLLLTVFFIIRMRENFVFVKIKDKAFLGMLAIFIKAIIDISFYSFFEYKTNIFYFNVLLLKPIVYFLILYLLLFFTKKEEENKNGFQY